MVRSGRALIVAIVFAFFALLGAACSSSPSSKPKATTPTLPAGVSSQPAYYLLIAEITTSKLLPVNLSTMTTGKPIPVNAYPITVGVSSDGRWAYVAGGGALSNDGGTTSTGPNTVTAVDLATAKPSKPIPAGYGPFNIAFTPDNRTAYIADMGLETGANDGYTVTPIDVATQRPLPAITVCAGPGDLAITPDGGTAYVTCAGTPSHPLYTVIPIDTRTNRPKPAIHVGIAPMAIAISPDGRLAYVANSGWPGEPGRSVTPIDMRTDEPGRPIPVGLAPLCVAFTPNGSKAYVADSDWSQGNQLPTTTSRRSTSRVASPASRSTWTAVPSGSRSRQTASVSTCWRATPNGP